MERLMNHEKWALSFKSANKFHLFSLTKGRESVGMTAISKCFKT